jgi:hypothetical protein
LMPGPLRADNESPLGGARFAFELPVILPSCGEVRGVAIAQRADHTKVCDTKTSAGLA